MEKISWIKATVSEVALSSKLEPLTVMTNINLSPEDTIIVQGAAICALRYAYHTTVDEPLPARIMALLKELAACCEDDVDATSHRPRGCNI